MKRVFGQLYVKNSVEAVETYIEAFGATLGYHVKHDDGSYYHSELELGDFVVAVAEQTEKEDVATGNTMQLCMHYGEGNEKALFHAYEVLKEGASISIALGESDFSPYMADLVDKFGVRWCLFL